MADQHNDDEGGRVGSSLSLKSTSPHSQVFASTITLSKKYDGPSNRSFKSKSTIGIHAHGSGFVGPLILPSLHGSLDSDDEGGIHRMKIGLLGCCIVLLGCVLGSGIFAAPQGILNMTGNAGVTLLVWLSAGLIALIAALSFVELGCTFPVSGGDYAYLNECFGSYPAFLFQISHNLVVCPVCGAIMGTVIAKNLLIPNIPSSHCPEIDWAVRLVAIMFIMLLVLVNCKNPQLTGRIQGSLMVINVAAIALMLVCGLTAIGLRKGMPHANFKLQLKPGLDAKAHVLNLVNALYQASFSYFGYTYVNYITEELENPTRNLPIGVCISMPIIICLNLFINFCYIATIPLEEMMTTTTIADNMFRAVLPDHVEPYVAWMATSLVAVAVTGGLTSYFLTCSRISYTGARNGDFPAIFKLVDVNHGTPVVSIILIGVLASCFTMVGTIPDLILVAAYLESFFNCVCIYGLIYVRFKRPDIPRPIKFPLFVPILYAAISTLIFVIPIVLVDGSNYKTSLYPVAGIGFVVLLGTPLYLLLVRPRHAWPPLIPLNAWLMKTCQKLWLVIPEELLPPDHDEGEEELVASSSSDVTLSKISSPGSVDENDDDTAKTST
ncbi:large neutral amino acids transporter small subunit 1 [Folsomia candida]|uniref:Y+L amino acid transporter 1 n=1 Tax=Folsomia candida TaxID=158441 RepID=A0A226EGF9_FOLCA|nr:large neutral amino acids transporter small subunit 1 [Folsomia candida]OXA56652.1 Y+L amino acid transporter 1 [Folsomia candida]